MQRETTDFRDGTFACSAAQRLEIEGEGEGTERPKPSSKVVTTKVL